MTAPRHQHFDVFNGDADGLCALQQLRRAEPRESVLITGSKRDQALLGQVMASPGDSVTVLDIPLGVNLDALIRLLDGNVSVEYFDHHHAAEKPEHKLLRLTLDASRSMCTSLLVNRYLAGRFGAWAVVGAFGDNMPAPAAELARSIGLDQRQSTLLKALGECLNYNAYGESEADLSIPPAQLHRLMASFDDPFEFMAVTEAMTGIAEQRAKDLWLARKVEPIIDSDRLIAVLLPDVPWARRVIGIHANDLVNGNPGRLCAVLVPNGRNSLTVSLRAPEGCGMTADQLARRHGGDGRASAAGINDLPVENLGLFLKELQ